MEPLDHMDHNRPPLRRARRDTGTIRITSRDVAVIAWIAEQYAAPVDTLALLLGDVSRTTVQRWIGRMRGVGWVNAQQLLGRTWIWPTSAALRATGREQWRARAPVVIRLDHLEAVGRVRIWYARRAPEALWVSERALASWSAPDAVTPDGALQDVDGGAIAVQVERTLRPEGQYFHIIQTLGMRYQRIAYVCAEPVRRRLEALVGAPPFVGAPIDLVSLEAALAATTPSYKAGE